MLETYCESALYAIIIIGKLLEFVFYVGDGAPLDHSHLFACRTSFGLLVSQNDDWHRARLQFLRDIGVDMQRGSVGLAVAIWRILGVSKGLANVGAVPIAARQ